MIFKVLSKMENKSDKVKIQEWMDQTLKDLTQRIENLKIDLEQSDETCQISVNFMRYWTLTKHNLKQALV